MPEQREPPRGFFPMGRGDAVFLSVFLVLAAVGFLIPGLRSARFAGIALFGWWMAGLMVLVPVVALWRSARQRTRSGTESSG